MAVLFVYAAVAGIGLIAIANIFLMLAEGTRPGVAVLLGFAPLFAGYAGFFVASAFSQNDNYAAIGGPAAIFVLGVMNFVLARRAYRKSKGALK